MDIITSLGVNSTVFVQLAIFFIVYLGLYFIAFKPYYKAYLVRREKTVGNSEIADRVLKETQDLEQEFATKAREQNERFKELFDRARTEGMREYETVVNQAREKSRQTVDEARAKLQTQAQAARVELKKQVPEVASVVVSTILGKEALQ